MQFFYNLVQWAIRNVLQGIRDLYQKSADQNRIQTESNAATTNHTEDYDLEENRASSYELDTFGFVDIF